MNFDENKYDQIQDYLDGSLSQEELRDFEVALQQDKLLAQEVDLHSDMQDFLKDSEENDLRQNLAVLNNQPVSLPTKPSRNKWKYALIFAGLALLTAVWFLLPKNEENSTAKTPTVTTESKKEERQPPIATNQDSSINRIDTKQNTTPSASPEITKPIKKGPQQKKKKELPSNLPEKAKKKDTIIYANQPQKSTSPDEPAPIIIDAPVAASPSMPVLAANFEPNPQLEFYVGNNLRDGEIQFEVEKLSPLLFQKELIEKVDFGFSGYILSNKNLLEEDLILHLFSNDSTAFQSFLPISTDEFTLSESEENKYSFDFGKIYTISEGLYYILVENKATEKIYFGERFTVEK